MKLYVVLLHVAAILFIAGSTKGDENGGCPVKDGNEPMKLNDMLKDGLNECFGKLSGLDLVTLIRYMKADVSFVVLREYCQKEDLVKNCLSTLTTRYSACPNATQENQFVLLEDVLKTAFGFGCLENGANLVSIMYTVLYFSDNSTTEHDGNMDCLARALSTQDDGNSMLGFYHQFKVFRKCIMDKMRGQNGAMYGAQVMLSAISKSIRCRHPDDGTLVLCETLDQTPSTEATTCLFTNINAATQSKLGIFLNFATQCVFLNKNQLDFMNVINFTTTLEYETFFSTYCQNRPYILNCFGDISSISETCLPEANHRVTEIFVDSLKTSLDVSCKQDGASLATIFNGFLNPDQSGVGYDTGKLCMETFSGEFKRAMNTTDSLPSKVMTAYMSAVSLRQCILDGSTDVNSFKTVFEAITNEIRVNAKCIDPVTGSSDLCESLINSVHN